MNARTGAWSKLQKATPEIQTICDKVSESKGLRCQKQIDVNRQFGNTLDYGT